MNNPTNISLILVHPCDKENKGGCSQICNKKGDEALCACDEGFELDTDGQTCNKSK